jgi:cation diffusion facilitator CzcD-associated flavoprotein CzcO
VRPDFAQVTYKNFIQIFAQIPARHSLEAGHDVTVFEQQSDIGGTWLYSPELNSFSSLYEDMVTNLPKEIMMFEHLKFETKGRESFVRHEEVLAFLKRYAESVRHLIKVGYWG